MQSGLLTRLQPLMIAIPRPAARPNPSRLVAIPATKRPSKIFENQRFHSEFPPNFMPPHPYANFS